MSRFKVAYLANTSDEKVTTGESVTSSISRATKYFEDAGTGSEQLELFWYNGARYGRVDIMEWAHRQGYARVRNNAQFQWRWRDVGKQVCIRAAKYGQLASLQWLRQNNCCWDDDTAYAAAAGGHFPVLQLAIDNGCDCWDAGDTCSAAAAGGQLSILQWLIEIGYPWDEGTCCSAAEGGHLSVLQWATENGCPWWGSDFDDSCTVVYEAVEEAAIQMCSIMQYIMLG